VEGRAIFYADRITGSMARCIDETKRRREIQRAYNIEHGITPTSVVKSTEQVRFITRVADARGDREEKGRKVAEQVATYASEMDTATLIELLESQMKEAAANLDFESAAALRDQLLEVKARGSPAAHKRGEGLSRIRAPR
jgi:excinuclease ABC subunit B